MENSLEEVLEEVVVEPETPTEETETPQPEEVEAVEDETEEVTEEPAEPEGVEQVEPPSATKEVPLAAMLDERDKRKALQAELEALKAAQAEKSEKPDFWENPEAAIDAKVNVKVSELQQQFTNGYLSLSMAMSSKFHDDFDVAKEAFARAAEENPTLAQMAVQSEMPGEYIYNTGKQFMELDAVGGDVNSLREKIRAEERAKLMEELKSKESKLSAVPTPITDETSAMAPREKVEGGPESLESILPNN